MRVAEHHGRTRLKLRIALVSLALVFDLATAEQTLQ
jgi:hypothetical protein